MLFLVAQLIALAIIVLTKNFLCDNIFQFCIDQRQFLLVITFCFSKKQTVYNVYSKDVMFLRVKSSYHTAVFMTFSQLALNGHMPWPKNTILYQNYQVVENMFPSLTWLKNVQQHQCTTARKY